MLRFGKCVASVMLIGISLSACNTNQSPAAPTAVVQPGPTVSAPAPSPTPSPGGPVGAVTVQGSIESIGSPEIIMVNGQRIRVNSNATVRLGARPSSFTDLRVGMLVRVFAESDGANTFQASVVEVLSQ